jgi:hypothetical protein
VREKVHSWRFCALLNNFIAVSGLDHGVGHFRLLSITRQRHYGIAMSHEGLCQVF